MSTFCNCHGMIYLDCPNYKDNIERKQPSPSPSEPVVKVSELKGLLRFAIHNDTADGYGGRRHYEEGCTKCKLESLISSARSAVEKGNSYVCEVCHGPLDEAGICVPCDSKTRELMMPQPSVDRSAEAGRLSRNCYIGEHSHCGGQVKFANADNTDDCFPCDCSCHKPSPASGEKGLDPHCTHPAYCRDEQLWRDTMAAELEAKVEECALAAETMNIESALNPGHLRDPLTLRDDIAKAIRSLSKTGSLDKLLKQARLEEHDATCCRDCRMENGVLAECSRRTKLRLDSESTLSPPDGAAGQDTDQQKSS